MKINGNVGGWVVLLVWAYASFWLWRTGIRPGLKDPQGIVHRAIYIFGAVLMTTITLYFIGYGLGFYRLAGH
jgi:hypothetical protein